MKNLAVRALVSATGVVGLVAGVLFVSAGSVRFPAAWALVAGQYAVMITTNAYLLVRAPELLERRFASNREPDPAQRVGRAILSVLALALFAAAGLDRRWGWSRAPSWVEAVGFVMTAAGALLVFSVLRQNRHAAVVVDVTARQTVVDSGPYRWIRHPMYAGALLQAFGVPLAIGSYAAEVFATCCAGIVIARLLGEERMLERELEGYTAYVARTRHRLLPRVW